MNNFALLLAFMLAMIFTQVLQADSVMEAAVIDASGASHEPVQLGLSIRRTDSGQETSVAGTHESLQIRASLVPNVKQIGQRARLHLVAEAGGIFYAANVDGAFSTWDGDLATLPIAHDDLLLTSSQDILLLDGAISVPAAISFYIGYSTAESAAFFYTPIATRLETASPIPFLPTLNDSLVGVDYTQLHSAELTAQSLGYVDSLLVARSGQLVLERYFDGGNADTARHIRSVTKSISSLVTGMAIESGVFNGLNQTLGSLQGPWIPTLTTAKGAIEIRHLLSMTSGLDWNESGGTLYDQWESSSDPVSFVLSRNLVATPGTVYRYNSAAVNLLSPMVQAATGTSFSDFAQARLFDPLEIDSAHWGVLGDGLPNSAGGMQMRPRDLIKLGQLLLNDGLHVNARNEVSRLLETDWLKQMLQPRVTVNSQFGAAHLDYYAYLWWIASAMDKTIYLAWGWGGQFLAVIPELDLVVVTNADWSNLGGTQASLQERTLIDLMVNEVLPAFQTTTL